MFKELTPDMIGTRDTVRQNSQRGGEEIKIELSKITVREGFNVRTELGDIAGLAQSILENGQTVAGHVDVLADGTFLLTDGHRRFKACQLLAEQGNEPLFKAIVNDRKTTEEQRILQMFTTQDNKPLEPHEVAELIQRLCNLGYNQSDVARKIGKTASYVSQMLSYASESPEVKEIVKSGKMTVSTVLKVKKEIPKQSERTTAIKNTVNGSTRPVTAEDVTDKKKNAMDRLAAEIVDVFQLPEGSISTIKTIIKKHI